MTAGRALLAVTLVLVPLSRLPGNGGAGRTPLPLASVAAAQTVVSDADLASASAGRTVAVGSMAARGRISRVPLEVYVARVLAGEAEASAPAAGLEALAIAIRTFAIVNAGRHAREGFDLCDTTHCQVPRDATAATRRAALSTAGRVLTYMGAPVEIFYSASCGGRSERASEVWPGADLPYLESVDDADVHEDDAPWTLELTLREVQQRLARAGVIGRRLENVRIESRNESGRVSRLRLEGLTPETMRGEPFRAALGYGELRSTAFEIDRDGESLRFTGRGYGHGVGLCTIGAARRARRGDTAGAILNHYFPKLTIAPLE